MESTKRKTSPVLLVLCVTSLLTALLSLAFNVYLFEKSANQEARLTTLEDFIKRVAIESLKVPTAQHIISRRDTAETHQDLLSQLTIHDVLGLRGVAGRDGRDGRDGKDGVDCDCHETQPRSTNSSQVSQQSNADLLAAIQRGFSNLEHPTVQPSESESTQAVTVRGGSTYVRWGRTTCGDTASLVYEGFAGGTHYTHEGGASNYQCLPLDPDWGIHSAADTGSWFYGAEYQSGTFGIFPNEAHDDNVPCARCYAQTRSATMMIPGKNTCPDSWTKEYDGYLMAGHHSHKRAYNYECVDGSPEYIAGRSGNEDGALFYFVQISCASTGHCPPYIQSGELVCAVCTK